MSGFSPQWLALREPADTRARAPGVRAAAAAHLAALEEPRILDLACGTGSTLRALAPCLGPRQSWRLIDHDPALLQAARSALCAWAGSAQSMADGGLVLGVSGNRVEVAFECADLAAGIGPLLSASCDLVAASAFFDLAGDAWITAFCAELIARRLPLYAALTFTGAQDWSEPHAADAAIAGAFIVHQWQDKGLGVAAGPKAEGLLAGAFEAAGWPVLAGGSPWALGPGDAALMAELLAGAAAAVAETGMVAQDIIDDWTAARRQSKSCVVAHADLFASPPA